MSNRLIESRLRSRRGEEGATLLWVAGMLVVLLGVSAFAIDLGWLYLNSYRLTKAADAAALAGVVNLPASPGQADIDAQAASSANAFPIGGTNTFASEVLPENSYEVTLGTSVNAFFLRVLGFESFDIARTSTARYILPVPMGSPANCFGIGDVGILNDDSLPSSTEAAASLCDGYVQNFWAAVNGPRTARQHGDPYLPACFEADNGGCIGGPNDDYDPNHHYFYGIEVPAGKTFLDVWIYDGGFYQRNNEAGNCNTDMETGDCGQLAISGVGGADTSFVLKRPDTTPHDPNDNPVQCTLTINAGTHPETYKNNWARLCSQIANPDQGIWVLQVTTVGNHGGSNMYSILANTSNITSGPMPRVFAINDMSIFTNEGDGNATVWLAEIEPVHAGKKLELRFYDPGEGRPPATLTVQMPNGSTPNNCSWTADNGLSGNSCSFATTTGSPSSPNYLFNGAWITMIVDIPDAYTCDRSANNNSGCYWRTNLDLDVSHDRTTWTARVIGNPVRLIPND